MPPKQKDGKKRKRQAGVSGIVTAGKKQVVYDEEARKEWLTGFSKRKLQRRKYGLAMQALKDRQHRLDERKARRDANRSAQGLPENASFGLEEDGAASGSEDDEIIDEADLQNQPRNGAEEVKLDDPSTIGNAVSFADQDTTSMFGGVVTVITSAGLDDENEDDDDEEEEEQPKTKAQKTANAAEESKRRKQQMFENAMKKAAIKAKRKKQRSKPNPFRAGADASKLLNKATGKVLKKRR